MWFVLAITFIIAALSFVIHVLEFEDTGYFIHFIVKQSTLFYRIFSNFPKLLYNLFLNKLPITKRFSNY